LQARERILKLYGASYASKPGHGWFLKVHLPNSATLQNITGFLGHLDTTDPDRLEFSMHSAWVAVHPSVVAMTAALAADVRQRGGEVTGEATNVPTLPYLMRMGLFRELGIDPVRKIVEHEESGRFIPLTQIRNTDDLKGAIANLVPLLHAAPEFADPIRYVFSEMVRNVLEHAASPIGAFICANYYKESGRIAIGIADRGRGILESMRRSHQVSTSAEAVMMALQPGMTGATSKIGGNEFNAGAGLFFVKSIAALGRNRFFLYSGDALFRLMMTPKKKEPKLFPDPRDDYHTLKKAQFWQGTVIGIDLSIEGGVEFSSLLSEIRGAYFLDVKHKKKFSNKIRFA
jgi:anti-sigma regulatory factor (Ser/Thr protein kinase)